ncbi:hypothetical protein HOB10_04100 [Candidatus Parcubacteria bacterium]|jgi:hypothetical protein|nr:hypothetical protein [Candidatus Parcubacteria bacterium]
MELLRKAKVFYRDRLVFWLLNFSILFILGTWALFLIKKIEQGPLTVLHYNIYVGIDMFGHSKWLYIVPGIVLAFTLLNIYLAVLLWTKQRIMSYFLLVSSLLVNSIIFIYIFNILNRNLNA